MLLPGYVIYVKLKLNFTPGGVRVITCYANGQWRNANTAGY